MEKSNTFFCISALSAQAPRGRTALRVRVRVEEWKGWVVTMTFGVRNAAHSAMLLQAAL